MYVGLGGPVDFLGRDVSGKVALIITIPQPGMRGDEPRGTDAVKRATEHGAAAAIVVPQIPGNFTIQMWPNGTTIPAVCLGQADGATLLQAIEQGSPNQAPKVRMTVRTEMESLRTASVWGVLPGTTDENILVMAHYDGFFQAAMDNASGVAVMLGLAEYFARLPKSGRRRSVAFVGFATHHEPDELWRRWMMTTMKPFLSKTALIVNSEHASLVEWYQYGDRLRTTNGIAARRVSVSGSQRLKEILMRDLRLFGIRTYADFDKQPAGEIRAMFQLAPGFQTIRDGVYYHSDQDVPEVVPAEGLQEVARAYAKVIDDVDRVDIADLRA